MQFEYQHIIMGYVSVKDTVRHGRYDVTDNFFKEKQWLITGSCFILYTMIIKTTSQY